MMILKPPSKEVVLEVIHLYLHRTMPLADVEMSAWRRALRRAAGHSSPRLAAAAVIYTHHGESDRR